MVHYKLSSVQKLITVKSLIVRNAFL
jgi:hypothetical protein